MLKAAFITPDLSDPSARLRISNHLPLLAKRRVEAEAMEIPRAGFGRFRFFRDLRRFDVVVLHRKLLSFLDLAVLRRRCRSLVFDFDDAVMCRVPWKGGKPSRVRTARFTRTVAWSDTVIAGSPLLRDLTGPARDRCVVIPTAVDLAPFTPPLPYPSGPPVFGWIGQRSSLPYLEGVSSALSLAGTRVAGMRLRVIADGFPSIPGIDVEKVPWGAGTEARDLGAIRAGLAPLTDDQWSAGKCAYKVLQYFAAARPAIASPVGMNAIVVLDGVNGFHAAGDAQWAERICAMASDPVAAAAMGRAGRTLVEERYSLEAASARLSDVLSQAASAARSGRGI